MGGVFAFAGSGARLVIDGTTMQTTSVPMASTIPSITISGFAAHDAIDLANVAYGAGEQATLLAGNVLQITENATTLDLHFDPGQNFAGTPFLLASDGGTGTDITLTPTLISGPYGGSTIDTGSGNADVTLTGYGNLVSGGDGSDIVSGGAGATTVTLGNGNDVVTLGGYANAITLGNGNNTVSAGAGSDSVTVGGGADTITLAGYGNVVSGGGGNDTVTGGQGDATVTLGNGNDTVTLGGGGNHISLGSGSDTVTLQGWGNSVSLGAGSDDSITDSAGGGGNTIDLSGGTASLLLNGSYDMLFLGSAAATITDQSVGLQIEVSADVTEVINNFGAGRGAVIDLIGGVGGYGSAQQVLAALTSDGHGGSMLALDSTGSIDFVGLAANQLHASNFQIG
jgi:Ca2+-binding RTX toxin-like protein